jgi:hypothetical protein
MTYDMQMRRSLSRQEEVPPHVLKFITSALFQRRHIATRLLSEGTMFCKLGTYQKTVEHIASRWILSCFLKVLCILILK